MFRLQPPLPDRYTRATDDELVAMIGTARASLGDRVVILGHHYQRDEVMRWADARGDSYGLARFAADQHKAEYVVFCGVTFMAEAADILTAPDQKVLLPDLNAGCQMADMADLEGVETAWSELGAVVDLDAVVPVTYMNSSAAIKAFVGRHRGTVCTSANANTALRWALGIPYDSAPGPELAAAIAALGHKVIFLPDQHLGRNTIYALGFGASSERVWDPNLDSGGLTEADLKEATFLLWKGHCSVHQRFTPDQVVAFRAAHPDGKVVVHPECAHEVAALADKVGSTDTIIHYVEGAAPGTAIGIGTEIHLVHRLATEHPELTIASLDPLVCPCSTMFRIDPPHLAWVLEGLVEGDVRNQIVVDEGTATDARVALERMLEIGGSSF
ncbi:MAG TPA: quinolinate synthase NadA [Acidimicrobiales bacterium]|nr:quinolinate synthase NadA [Acidimicrobiales bacterium]